MSEIGDSVHHVDQLLAEAQDFHMMTAVSVLLSLHKNELKGMSERK